MKPDLMSRRLFLGQGATIAGAAWSRAAVAGLAAAVQVACTAKEEQRPFAVLSSSEATEFESIASRIIPTTDTPGAKEAGVIYFLDQSFTTFNAPLLPLFRGGLQALQDSVRSGVLFSELAEDEQDNLLIASQATPFFQLMRMMSFAGYFGLSEYGGNKDGIGWDLLGMNPGVHAYTAPFGYYDENYTPDTDNV